LITKKSFNMNIQKKSLLKRVFSKTNLVLVGIVFAIYFIVIVFGNMIQLSE
jgi:hypothetical protein